jgi:hypothetical protein
MGKIYSYFSYPYKYEYILRIIEITAPFLAASYTSFYSLGEKKYTKSLREFMSIGIIPLSFFAALRHFFFFGKAKYFELDGVGANLGLGIAGIVALCKNSSNETLGAIFVASVVYMIINTISWILYRKNSSEKYFMVGSSIVIIALTIYFTYIAYNEKTDFDEDF